MYKTLNTIWTLVLLGILSITFVQEQETESQSGGEVSPEVVEESPCALGEVQVKLINAGTVLCVNKDTADSWIEGGFAVAFDEEPEQEPEQEAKQEPQEQEPEQEAKQEPQEQESEQGVEQELSQPKPEQEAESESSKDVSSATIAENSCDPGQVQVKIINAGTVRCVERATADLWIEGGFAVAVDGELEQETEGEVSNEVSSATAKGNPCESEEVWVKLINAGTVLCVDKDTAESWIESDFAVEFDGKSE